MPARVVLGDQQRDSGQEQMQGIAHKHKHCAEINVSTCVFTSNQIYKYL